VVEVGDGIFEAIVWCESVLAEYRINRKSLLTATVKNLDKTTY
jgi:hypothetical protein